MFDEIFAVSDDDLAVRFNYSRPGWRPLTPSRRLAHKVYEDTSLHRLDKAEVEREFEYIDPPRNFSLEWRVRQRSGGWVAAGLLLLPGIPLWFVWEDYLRWAGGYGEIAVGVVTVAQISLLVGLRDRLTERMVKLAIRLDHWQRGKTLSGTPTGLSFRTGHPTVASLPERVSSGKNLPEAAPASGPEEPKKKTENYIGDPLEYATIALMSDAYSYQAKNELIEKFGLGEAEADRIVCFASGKIMQNLEARNPEAWKSLGLRSERPQSLDGDQYIDDLVDRGRMAGMDPDKLREAFQAVSPEKLRELESAGKELAALGRRLDLQNILGDATAFGSTEGYYVEHRGRTFFYSSAEGSWTQSFQGTVPREAIRMAAKDLQTLVFDESATDKSDCIAQFVRLAQDAVEADQTVQLNAKLPDGAEKTARLHAAKWAGLLLGFPVIVRDEAPDGVMEWHFNDYPGNATIYRVRDDDADPLELAHEVNWLHLQRKVLENRGRTETQAEHADLSEHEFLHNPKGAWTVYVDDHFHYMRLEERYTYGVYDSYEAAVAVCRMIVDRCLEGASAKSAEELIINYLSFGDDPWIEGPSPGPGLPSFSALDYAKQRCREIRP